MILTKIRTYRISDKKPLIDILRMLTPEFFAPSEENDFREYLDQQLDRYFVVEENEKVIGAGGFNRGFDNGTSARISWDLIHPKFRGQGIGSELLGFRIDKLKKEGELDKIVVRTTQHSYPFYQSGGFSLVAVEENFWADGYDLYHMEMKL